MLPVSSSSSCDNEGEREKSGEGSGGAPNEESEKKVTSIGPVRKLPKKRGKRITQEKCTRESTRSKSSRSSSMARKASISVIVVQRRTAMS